MIGNCDVLVTQYSSTAFVGLALGKEVHSRFDPDELRKLMPIQNNCAAKNISVVCRKVLGTAPRRDCGRACEPASRNENVARSYAYETACCNSGQNEL